MDMITRCFSGMASFMEEHRGLIDVFGVGLEADLFVPDEGVTEFWCAGSKESLDGLVAAFEDLDSDGENFGGWWDEKPGECFGELIDVPNNPSFGL